MQRCITGLKPIGLKVSPKKTKIINVGLAAEKFSRVVNCFNEQLPNVKVTELTKVELLGSPMLNDATRCCIVKKLSEHKRMNDRILLLDGHPGLFRLKNDFSLPRLLFTLRSAPCHYHPEILAEYDEITRSTTEALCNIHLVDNSWSQTKLPVRYGGLGLRTAADLALPGFCPHARRVSVWSTTSIVSHRINKRTTMRFGLGWTEISSYLPTLISKVIGTIFSAFQPSPPWFPYSTSIVWHASRRLRVLNRAPDCSASQATESALSSTTTLRIGVALRVGLTVFIPHR